MEWAIDIGSKVTNHVYFSQVEFRLIVITRTRFFVVKKSTDLRPREARISHHSIFKEMV
jgi:hypothetical protein